MERQQRTPQPSALNVALGLAKKAAVRARATFWPLSFLPWFRQYKVKSDLWRDAIAGMTVAAMVVPQGPLRVLFLQSELLATPV